VQFWIIIAPAVLIALVNWAIFSKKVVWQEVVGQVFGIMAVVAMVVFGYSASKKRDTEILNGHVTSKARHEVHCRHSYPCNPHSCMCDSKGNCSTCWDTCYVHSYDVDWDVYASCGMLTESFSVNTIDSQGLQEPPRWTAFKAGDPFMTDHGYDNYVKANASTLYQEHGYQDKFAKVIPGYPNNIYDYHTHLDRVVQIGYSLPDLRQWDDDLTQLNIELGSKKQCNVILFVMTGQPEDYYYGLKEAWIGGKKNDVIVMVNVDAAGTIQWANCLSWAKNDMFRVKLRDDLMAIGKLDRVAAMKVIHDDVEQYFVRTSMKEFKYLDKAIILTNTEFWWILVITALVSLGISIFFDEAELVERYSGNRFGGY
jgi:hypothetical protein